MIYQKKKTVYIRLLNIIYKNVYESKYVEITDKMEKLKSECVELHNISKLKKHEIMFCI